MPKPWTQSLAPLPLRIALGLTFVWAGLGKIEATMTVQGEQAALLATMGVERVRREGPPFKTTPPAPAASTPPASTTPPPPVSQPQAPEPEPSAPATPPAAPPATSPSSEPAPAPPASTARSARAWPMLAQVTVPPTTSGVGTPQADRVYAASEFPDQITLPRLYGLALLLHKAAHPQTDASGVQPRKLWPSSLAGGSWPVALAWSVAITELVGGLLVLLGLLTRVSALALAGTMLGAIWLTEIGPALQARQVVLGFLPARDPFDVAAWRTLGWQLSLLGAALTLALLGSGALGFDRKLFPPPPPAPPPSSIKPMM